RRYQACPPSEKWELIGGVVYMASPLRYLHGEYDTLLGLVFGLYWRGTPGISSGHNVTTILREVSEPQPDLTVRLLPEYGGHSFLNEKGYLTGPPELVAEIAHSSRAIDLHEKRDDYLKAGV